MEYINLLDHPITLEEYPGQPFEKMATYVAAIGKKPKVEYKTVKINHPLISIQAGDKFPVKVYNLPEIKENVVYIVNAFILEALVSIDKKYALHFASVGKQHRGENGKVLYAKGLYIKDPR